MHFSHQKALDVGDSLYLFTTGRGGGVFFKMLFLSQKDSRPLAPEWAAGPSHSRNVSGRKDGVGRQGLPQELPRPTLPAARPTSGKKKPNPESALPLGLLKLGLPPSLPTSCFLPLLPTRFSVLPRPTPTSWALQPSLPPCKVLSHPPGLPIVNKTQVCSPGPLQLILSGDASPTPGCLNPVTVHGPRGWPTRVGPRGRSAPSSNRSLANGSLSSPPPAPDPGAAAAQPTRLQPSQVQGGELAGPLTSTSSWPCASWGSSGREAGPAGPWTWPQSVCPGSSCSTRGPRRWH